MEDFHYIVDGPKIKFCANTKQAATFAKQAFDSERFEIEKIEFPALVEELEDMGFVVEDAEVANHEIEQNLQDIQSGKY